MCFQIFLSPLSPSPFEGTCPPVPMMAPPMRVMGFHPAIFGLPRPFRSRVRSRHATDRRADTAVHFIMPLLWSLEFGDIMMEFALYSVTSSLRRRPYVTTANKRTEANHQGMREGAGRYKSRAESSRDAVIRYVR